MRAFWQWECDVQAWWGAIVLDVADRYGTDSTTQLRMMRLGWKLLRVLTWPQSLVRRCDYWRSRLTSGF